MSKTAEVIDTPPVKPARPPILPAARFGVPGQYRQEWLATIPEDIPWNSIHAPGFWGVVMPRIRIGDTIEVRNDTLTRVGRYLVNFCEPSTGAMNLVAMEEHEFDKAIFTAPADAAYFARYDGVQDQFVIVRAKDGLVMRKGLRSQQEARSRIAQEFGRNMGNPLPTMKG